MTRIYKQITNVLILLFILGLGCFLFFFLKHPELEKEERNWITIPVSFFPFHREPLIQVEIEGKKYTLLIDTGSPHHLDLHKRVLEKLHHKEFIRVENYYDLKGNRYLINVFRAPPIKFCEHLEIDGLFACEESIDFLTTGIKIQKATSLFGKFKEQFRLFWIDGRISCSSFKRAVPYFDFRHRCLYLAKDLNVLQEEGIFHPNDFIALPFTLCRSGPVISIETEFGEKRFLIDSGASHSVFMEPTDSSLTLKIGGLNFGSWHFFSWPLSPDFKIEHDGILGVDFFKKHAICLNFQEGIVYIQK